MVSRVTWLLEVADGTDFHWPGGDAATFGFESETGGEVIGLVALGWLVGGAAFEAAVVGSDPHCPGGGAVTALGELPAAFGGGGWGVSGGALGVVVGNV